MKATILMENTFAAKNTPKIKIKITLKNKYKIKNIYLNNLLSYSLIDILVALSISIILISITILSYQQFFQSNKNLIATHKLINTLNYATHYAIFNNKIVNICPSIDLKHCSYNFFDWNKGYIIFTKDKIIKSQTISLPNNQNLSFHIFGHNKNLLTIKPNGTTDNNGHFFFNNQFICWNKHMRIYLTSKTCSY